MKNTLITSLVLCFTLQSCCTEISRAGKLNDTQRKDLFETGQITDDGGNLWNVRIIPGTDKIGEDFDEAWTDIGDIMGDFLEEEYYTDELGEAIDVGLEFAEKSVTEFWWDGCRNDIQAMKDDNIEVRATQPFGRDFILLSNHLETGGKVVGRTVLFPAGVVLGGAYAAVAPAVSVALRPAGAGILAVTKGSTFPAVAASWNTTVCLATWSEQVPTEPSNWVRLVKYADRQTLDKADLDVIIQAGIELYLCQQAQQEIQAEIDRLQEQIKQWNDQKTALQEQQNQFQRDLDRKLVSHQFRQLSAKAEEAQAVTLTDEVKAVLQTEKSLRNKITSTINEMPEKSLNRDDQHEICRAIQNELDDIIKMKTE